MTRWCGDGDACRFEDAGMKKKSKAPITFAEAAKQRRWGEGDDAIKPDPNVDRYFISTTGTNDPKWEPTMEDWARLAEMFRGR
jgi:hypothetical protein